MLAIGPAGRAAEPADPPCVRETFETSHFTVCRFEAQRHTLRLVWTGTDGKAVRRMPRLKSAGIDPSRVRFAINAGMFDDAGAPIGLYVEDGRQRHALNTADGPGNFHLRPNGVFWTAEDQTVHVDTAETFAAASPRPRVATQSGPMLLIAGALHPAIQADGPSRYVRNAVGVAGPGEAVFVISDDPVSFGRLARLFRDRLRVKDALYLDGTVSSLWVPAQKRMDDSFALGPILVISDRRR